MEYYLAQFKCKLSHHGVSFANVVTAKYLLVTRVICKIKEDVMYEYFTASLLL